jgi:RNA polymerase sigma-70 factor (ECF subfamily)
MTATGKWELVTPYLTELRSVAARLSRTPDDAEDLVQECLGKAMQGIGALRNREVVGAWLLQILRRAWYDRLRRAERERRAMGRPRPTSAEESDVDSDLIRAAMAELSAEDRRLLEMRFFEGRTSEEIGVRLRRHPGGVRASMFYALRRLEMILRERRMKEDP